MEQCIKCGHTIKDELFEGVTGALCKDCLKDLMIYHTLRAMALVKEVKEG